jgi:nucleoside 2-deoxyribosyltransferase
MKVYLAAAYQRKDEIRAAAEYLEGRGFEITSSWIREEYSPAIDIRTLPGGINQVIAGKDIEEIQNSDALIFFPEPQDKQPPRGGRHVEFGIALALGKRVIVVGERENIFHHLPQVEVVQFLDHVEVA